MKRSKDRIERLREKKESLERELTDIGRQIVALESDREVKYTWYWSGHQDELHEVLA